MSEQVKLWREDCLIEGEGVMTDHGEPRAVSSAHANDRPVHAHQRCLPQGLGPVSIAAAALKLLLSESTAWRSARTSVGRAARPVATAQSSNRFGGSGEIRTHGRDQPSPVFKTGALNRSATLPTSGALCQCGAATALIGARASARRPLTKRPPAANCPGRCGKHPARCNACVRPPIHQGRGITCNVAAAGTFLSSLAKGMSLAPCRNLAVELRQRRVKKEAAAPRQSVRNRAGGWCWYITAHPNERPET
jgi:hypothetical protein